LTSNTTNILTSVLLQLTLWYE